jgi:transcriptional/translational regulatory protein YebC/TACO1
VKDALAAADIEPASAEVTMLPQMAVECDAAMAASVVTLIDALEDHDDVQKVFHNADIAEDVMAKLS